MNSRYLALGALALTASMAVSSALAPPRSVRSRPYAQAGHAPLYVIGSRGAAQRSSPATKLDPVLADLARHAARARPGHVLADLHSLSPAASFGRSAATGAALVLIDATTRGNPEQLKSALVSLGLERPALYLNDVGGWLPVAALAHAAARGEVISIRATMRRMHAAVPAAQGDYAERSDVARATYPGLTGAGVTVGVISDSFDCYAVYAADGVPASGYQGYAYNGFTADYASDQATGALPANINVLAEPEPVTGIPCLDYQFPDNQGTPTGVPFSDEGRAMLQIVHAVAPDAALAFRTGADSEAGYASGIGELQQAGANIIADDLGFYDEPFFQDGLLAQAIDAVEAQGVAYFSAAGNGQRTPSYQNTAPDFSTLASGGANAGELLLNFDTTGATTATALPVAVPALYPGEFIGVVVQWDQPYVTGCTAVPATLCTGASSQIDVCVSGATGGVIVINYDNDENNCSGPNPLGSDPYQILIVGNPADATSATPPVNLTIAVGLANGTAAPGRLIVAVEDDGAGSSITSFATNGPTLQGHPGAAGAAAVGAAFYYDTPRCGTTPATLEAYSAAGGIPILFDTAGARLSAPITRQKPDFVGPDGVNTTFLGYQPNQAPFGPDGLLPTAIAACQNDPSYPNFFGTSAATPHAAAVAALMLQANAELTPAEIYGALQASASPMSGSSPDLNSGYGFIQADAALAELAPGTPALALTQASVGVGEPVTLSWSSPVATGCTASGSWSGMLESSGSRTVTPTAEGALTFTLACANSLGVSPAASVTLTVTSAPPSSGGGSGGGGGAIGGVALLGLAALTFARRRGNARPR